MELQLRSFCGIDRADIELAKGTSLLVGRNGVGKTNCIEALQTVLKAEPTLFETKKEIAVMIREGSKEGSILFACKAGKRKIEYPSCTLSTPEGSLPKVSDLALGLVTILGSSFEERAKILSNYLRAAASCERLIQELKELECPKDLLESIPKTIFGTEKNLGKGWDSGQKEAEAAATGTRGEFKRATGFQWGIKQGLSFTPPGWESDLADATEEALKKAITDANEKLESLIKDNAITEQQYIELQETAKGLDAAEAKVAEWTNTLIEVEREGKEASAALVHGTAKRYDCSCGQTAWLAEVEGALKAFDQEPDEHQTSLAKSTREAAALRFQNGRIALDLEKRKVAGALAAVEKLKNLEKPTTGAEVIEAARKEVEQAKTRLKAFEVKRTGVELHHRVVKCEKIAELLSPDGLRRKILASQLAPFNKELATLCDAVGYENVSIDADMRVRYNGKRRPSESQLYRAEAVIRLALCAQEKAPIVIFDRADVLDREGRNGLIKLVAHLGLNAVVGMTLIANKKQEFEVPNLRAAGLGVTYWVEDGTVKEYAAPVGVA